ncbi:hypothetical protein Afil01_46330 [Actinorhabdospora filicis]|uniref:Uncharacterized protein n=1 Tax=Actinorhabdospora filicis TaxID=1785913 RepID=A0A9W6SSA2_9ACTN|nr:hypothetical protein [Actinorhabdospora filicis]GLZ79826.1 hypothetical protein Afil01_46330 [Actinorhabdospora filicis]
MKFVDRVLDRLVGTGRARAACDYKKWRECVYSGICNTNGWHARYEYVRHTNCKVDTTWLGCC